MDTFQGLYLHNNIYYYRKRIQGKLYRKSLFTDNLYDAIRYVKILNKLKYEKKMDFKRNPSFIFQKLDNGFKITQENESDELFLKVVEKFASIESNTTKKDNKEIITFETIYNEFLNNKHNLGKVSVESFRSYKATYNVFKEFFNDKNLNELNTNDKNNLYTYLKSKNLQSKTINNHLSYLKQMFRYVENENILKHNFIKNIELVKEDIKDKENYTDTQLNTILTTDINFFTISTFNYYYLFKIAIYTGMRISEILLLTKDNISTDRIVLNQGKTPNAKRTIPLHKELNFNDILSMIDNFDIKYSNEIEKDKIIKYHTKNANRLLKKFNISEQYQTFHTIRGTFIQKLINNHPQSKYIIQILVGHSLDERDKLTIQTYAKSIQFNIYNEIIQSFKIII